MLQELELHHLWSLHPPHPHPHQPSPALKRLSSPPRKLTPHSLLSKVHGKLSNFSYYWYLSTLFMSIKNIAYKHYALWKSWRDLLTIRQRNHDAMTGLEFEKRYTCKSLTWFTLSTMGRWNIEKGAMLEEDRGTDACSVNSAHETSGGSQRSS